MFFLFYFIDHVVKRSIRIDMNAAQLSWSCVLHAQNSQQIKYCLRNIQTDTNHNKTSVTTVLNKATLSSTG